MRRALDETERRRRRQLEFNAAHGIEPKSVHKRIKDIIDGVPGGDSEETSRGRGKAARAQVDYAAMDEKELAKVIRTLEKTMQEHARNLEFEQAAAARDELFRLRSRAFGADSHGG